MISFTYGSNLTHISSFLNWIKDGKLTVSVSEGWFVMREIILVISCEIKNSTSPCFVFQTIMRDLLRFLLVYMIFLFGFAAGEPSLSYVWDELQGALS